MGKGPPYRRREEDNATETSVWNNSRRLERALKETHSKERRFVVRRVDRSFFALGLLGLEEDIAALDLREDA